MRHNPLQMEKWVRDCSKFVEQQYPMFSPFPHTLCDLDIYEYIVDNDITFKFDFDMTNCSFTTMTDDYGNRSYDHDLIDIHLGHIDSTIKTVFSTNSLNFWKKLPFRLKVEFVVFHEYGHWFLERSDRQRYDRYDGIRDKTNVKGKDGYRELPSEKWADNFALMTLRQKYPLIMRLYEKRQAKKVLVLSKSELSTN